MSDLSLGLRKGARTPLVVTIRAIASALVLLAAAAPSAAAAGQPAARTSIVLRQEYYPGAGSTFVVVSNPGDLSVAEISAALYFLHSEISGRACQRTVELEVSRFSEIRIVWAAVLQKIDAMRPIIGAIGRSGGLSAAG